MTVRITDVIVDCHDLRRESDFWTAALGYVEVSSGDGWVSLGPPGDQPSDDVLRRAPQAPVLAFVIVPESKMVKNRVHIDITPVDTSQAAEVARLIRLGAQPADIGQGATSWVVMTDPEGNEFCVLRALGEAEA